MRTDAVTSASSTASRRGGSIHEEKRGVRHSGDQPDGRTIGRVFHLVHAIVYVDQLPRQYSARQEEADLFEAALRCWILFQQGVVLALQRHKFGARYSRSQLTSKFDRNLEVTPCVYH